MMDKWPEEDLMMKLAMENNLSETAFIVKEEHGYHLRWFTPASEVDLCGHATLASSFVIFNYYEQEKNALDFDTRSGKLTVVRKGNLYEMDFPAHVQREVPVTDEMESAFGIRPVKAILGTDLVCIFDSEDQIREMNPDQIKLAHLPGRGQSVTAPGVDVDCVSRSFFPALMIPEDPVCGSVHCQIADYWSKELGKDLIHAYQASKRGGHLYCKILGNGRISISGEATLVAISDVVVF